MRRTFEVIVAFKEVVNSNTIHSIVNHWKQVSGFDKDLRWNKLNWSRASRSAKSLLEYFDSVEIMCSKTNASMGTGLLTRGRGDWFARQGMAHEFIKRDDAEAIGMAVAGTKEERS